MDHQSFAQLLGNYGEFVGAIAVVVTFVYLTTQIRQNTNAIRSSTYASWNEAAQSWGDFVADHAKTLAIVGQKASDQLTQEELFFAVGFAMKTFSQGQAAFLHHQAGSLPDEVSDAYLRGFLNAFEVNPVLGGIWRNGMRDAYAASFVQYVEQKVPALATDHS